MNYWQIAAGSEGRDYVEEFLSYGLAFVGGDDSIKTMEGLREDDRILLKRGQSKLIAVGRVINRGSGIHGAGDKDWLRDFDGWDLQAYCFVDWHIPDEPIVVQGLTRATIQQVHQQHLLELAEEVLSNTPARDELKQEPSPTKEVKDENILDFLIREGLRPGAADELTTTFKRIRRLAQYYYRDCDWSDIREHETRTFLVVPLLLALGWAEQQIKIELPAGGRGRIDLACFSKPYKHKDSEVVLIIETKGFSQGLTYAPEQAKAYAEQFPSCRAVVVSNGYCYKAYNRQKGQFHVTPSAYLNLLMPKDRYPLDPENVPGALEAMKLLLPHTW